VRRAVLAEIDRLDGVAARKRDEAQRLLIESKGGPEQVMANLPTKKLYTPVPSGLLS